MSSSNIPTSPTPFAIPSMPSTTITSTTPILSISNGSGRQSKPTSTESDAAMNPLLNGFAPLRASASSSSTQAQFSMWTPEKDNEDPGRGPKRRMTSPSRMAKPMKEMPKVAFTRAEMPQEQQTEFYKQTTDTINAVSANVQAMDVMLGEWRPWLRTMLEEQQRITGRWGH